MFTDNENGHEKYTFRQMPFVFYSLKQFWVKQKGRLITLTLGRQPVYEKPNNEFKTTIPLSTLPL